MTQPTLGNCWCCKASVSSDASTCPRCGQSLTDPWIGEAQKELAQDNLSNAIKVVRDATGMGKAEATHLVESWRR